MRCLKCRFSASEVGASLMEAVILVALISIVAVGSAKAVGEQANTTIGKVNIALGTGGGNGGVFRP